MVTKFAGGTKMFDPLDEDQKKKKKEGKYYP